MHDIYIKPDLARFRPEKFYKLYPMFANEFSPLLLMIYPFFRRYLINYVAVHREFRVKLGRRLIIWGIACHT